MTALRLTVIFSILFLPTIGFAATANLRPNGDDTILWGASPSWSVIDDAVTQPTAGSGDLITADKFDDLEENIWNMTTQAGVGTATQVVLWINSKLITSSVNIILTCRLNLGGWTSTQNITINSETAGWYSLTFTGTWTSGNVDGMQVGIKTPTISAAEDGIDMDVMYTEITYTAGTSSDDAFLIF